MSLLLVGDLNKPQDALSLDFMRSELYEASFTDLGTGSVLQLQYSTSVPYQKGQVWYRALYISIADPRYVSRFQDPNFFIPDPGSKRFRIRIKEFKYF
jgi:hypothetical protein